MRIEDMTSEVIIDALRTNTFTQFPEVDLVLRKAGKTREDLKPIKTRPRVMVAERKALDGLRSQAWHLEGDQKSIDIVKPIIKACWGKFCRAAMNAEMFGYSVLERVYEPSEDKRRAVGIRSLTEAPISRFKLDVEGKLWRRDPLSTIWEERDTKHKFLVMVNNPTSEQPMGEATLSALFWPDFFRQQLLKFNMIACEKYERPTIAAESDESDDKKRKKVVLQMLQGLACGAMLVPKDAQIKMLSKELKNPELFTKLMEYFDREVLMLFLGHHMGAEITGQGARSAIEGGSDILQDLSESRALAMEPMVQNFCDGFTSLAQIEPVEFQFSEIKRLNSDLAERDGKLHQQGVRFTADYYVAQYGFDKDHIERVDSGSATPVGDSALGNASVKKNHAARLNDLAKLWQTNHQPNP